MRKGEEERKKGRREEGKIVATTVDRKINKKSASQAHTGRD
jgi:hypothetical protein